MMLTAIAMMTPIILLNIIAVETALGKPTASDISYKLFNDFSVIHNGSFLLGE